jgi:hypothetical protein
MKKLERREYNKSYDTFLCVGCAAGPAALVVAYLNESMNPILSRDLAFASCKKYAPKPRQIVTHVDEKMVLIRGKE